MNAKQIIEQLLKDKPNTPQIALGRAFAPTNIALCKYWGKRNAQLNLPMTSSLSMTLPDKGTDTTIRIKEDGSPAGGNNRHTADDCHDSIILDGKPLEPTTDFYQRTSRFLDLFRTPGTAFHIETHSNIPTAAGLASSASGIAALVLALNDLYQWQCDKKTLSIMARLGSGSACRSLWNGFVEWHKGEQDDGLDSFAEPLLDTWPELKLECIIVSDANKTISSRDAMNQTVNTSPLYDAWPKTVEHDLALIKKAIATKDFTLLGETVEANALAMHATMLAARPAICYSTPETLNMIQDIWQRRRNGEAIYFTQDAGPNIKVLTLRK